MDNEQSTIITLALKYLMWSFLIVLILVGTFAIFYGITMHDMQSNQISRISKYLDNGEIDEIYHLAQKDMIITQGLFFVSFIISVCCLIMIAIFLSISLLTVKRKLKLKYNQAPAADTKGQAAEAQC